MCCSFAGLCLLVFIVYCAYRCYVIKQDSIGVEVVAVQKTREAIQVKPGKDLEECPNIMSQEEDIGDYQNSKGPMIGTEDEIEFGPKK